MREPSFYPTVNGDILSRSNLYRWLREFFRVSKMPQGFYAEFGVLNGEATLDAWRMLRGWLTHCWGFDSFAGLPSLSDTDEAAVELMPTFTAGAFQSMSRDEVERTLLAQGGMRPEELTLVEGFFEDSLARFDQERFVDQGPCLVAYVDCDLHSSTTTVLEFIEPHLTTGSWILLDDYWCYRGDPRKGQRRAFDEWLDKSERVGASAYGNFKGWGRAFIVHEL